jgi:predicted ATP-grasp superfamily ATP-dependent carboligase
LFGDTDTRTSAEASLVVAGDFESGFDAASLLAAAKNLAPAGARPPFGLVYSSGLESRPDLLASLAEGRQLYGNGAEAVGTIKDPRQFFPLLERLGIPHPEVRFDPPGDLSGWLSKGIGGSGGAHVRSARDSSGDRDQCYFQRRVAGQPIGISFLANGRDACIVGCNEQWTCSDDDSNEFRFGGTLQPAPLAPPIMRAMPEVLAALTREFGLVGLNSLDIMADGDEFHVIEVNPRPGANLDIYDCFDGLPLFGLHVAACEGNLPRALPTLKMATAMSVIYASENSMVPSAVEWPGWVADRPAPGATIPRGAPVCTVLDISATAEEARRAIVAKTDWVRTILRGGE